MNARQCNDHHGDELLFAVGSRRFIADLYISKRSDSIRAVRSVASVLVADTQLPHLYDQLRNRLRRLVRCRHDTDERRRQLHSILSRHGVRVSRDTLVAAAQHQLHDVLHDGGRL